MKNTTRFLQWGFILFFMIFLMSVLGPLLSGQTFYQIDLEHKNLPPNLFHWFGTDDLGRDVFTRVCYGARISLFIGMSAALIDMVIGIIWGGVAGYYGGFIDSILMRTADILYSLPYLIVVILLLVIMGPSLLTIICAMATLGWINMARMVRGQVMQIKQQEYIVAARAWGASNFRILFKHILPNAVGPILVSLSFTIPSAIFAEAFLSFLGLGVPAPLASWGTMASEGLAAASYFPWRLLFPAFFIGLTTLALNLIGEGLRSYFSVRE